jgi:hypothetical protein
MTSQNGRIRLDRVECLGWGLIYGVLAALPLCGLVLFMQITRPAYIHSGDSGSTKFVSYDDSGSRTAASPLSKHAAARLNSSAKFVRYDDSGSHIAASPVGKHVVARLDGVSAELGGTNAAEPKLLSSSDAELALNSAPRSCLKAGFRTEFISKDHHRVAIRIIRREAITDRAVPDNLRLMDIVPASTASTVRLAWGNWLYVAEVEDKGIEPEVVVQEVL